MSISYTIWDFPTSLPVRAQVFYAPGQAFEGGFTSGGVRITSPEPGGRSYLETELSLQTNEWNTPFVSWLMSKINGEIFRVRLTATPQLVPSNALGLDTSPAFGSPWAAEGSYSESPWDNDENWTIDDVEIPATTIALEGSATVQVDVSGFGPIITYGHVIGYEDSSYMVDNISYDGDVATITIKPPLRNDMAVGSLILLRPFFLGSISNGAELRAAYEAANVGHIQPARIIFSEVII